MSPDDAMARVLTGRTWEAFCDRLKEAGQVVLRSDTPATEIDRAEGWRYLSRLTRVALEMMVEHADPDFPTFYSASHPTAKIGADNPDNLYLNAAVTGDREYRLKGVRGTVPFLSFGTKANRYATQGTMASTGELDGRDLSLNSDGTFGDCRQPRAPIIRETGCRWARIQHLLIAAAQTFISRPNEIAATVTIERVGGPSRPEPLRSERLDHGLAAAAAFVAGTARTFADWASGFRLQPNTLATVDQDLFRQGDAATPASSICTATGKSPRTRRSSSTRRSRSARCGIFNSTITGWNRSTTGTFRRASTSIPRDITRTAR